MTVEEAIKTAMDYETTVKEVYDNAFEIAADPVGKRVFGALRDDEQHHLDYLNTRLEEWRSEGKLKPEKLETAIPSRKIIEEGVSKLRKKVKKEGGFADEMKMLEKAREVEKTTSDFYKKMVSELEDEAQEMFQRFVEIEEGHLAIVEAELDSIKDSGFWFDYMEFDLEG